jgi:hypothetical protein
MREEKEDSLEKDDQDRASYFGVPPLKFWGFKCDGFKY